MKLLIAIVNKRDIRHLSDALIDNDFRFTEIGSTGGFLRAGNVTLLIGVDDERVPSRTTATPGRKPSMSHRSAPISTHSALARR